MNINEMLTYIDTPTMQPLILEVGTLLLKVIYGSIGPDDLDKAKVLYYEKDIEADWLQILAEGNPAYIDDVLEQVHYDLCLGEETCLVIPSAIDIAAPKLDFIPIRYQPINTTIFQFGCDPDTTGEFKELDDEGEVE
jgi:hypothetical protein